MMAYRRKNPDGQGGYRDAMEKISDDLAATRLADDFIKHMRFPCPQCRNSVDACCSNGSPAVDMLSVGPADRSEGQFRFIVNLTCVDCGHEFSVRITHPDTVEYVAPDPADLEGME